MPEPFEYEVRGHADNQSSIAASLTRYKIVPGIVRVPLVGFSADFASNFYSVADRKRVDALKEKIKASGWVSPLIVVRDSEGLYVLEGAHRLVALHELGATDLPAMLVHDLEGKTVTEAEDLSVGKKWEIGGKTWQIVGSHGDRWVVRTPSYTMSSGGELYTTADLLKEISRQEANHAHRQNTPPKPKEPELPDTLRSYLATLTPAAAGIARGVLTRYMRMGDDHGGTHELVRKRVDSGWRVNPAKKRFESPDGVFVEKLGTHILGYAAHLTSLRESHMYPVYESAVTDALTNGKAVLIDNVWWQIASRDAEADRVVLVISKYALRDGQKPEKPREMKLSDLAAAITSGKIGANINGRRYGPKQDAEKRDKVRAAAGLNAAPGAGKFRESLEEALPGESSALTSSSSQNAFVLKGAPGDLYASDPEMRDVLHRADMDGWILGFFGSTSKSIFKRKTESGIEYLTTQGVEHYKRHTSIPKGTAPALPTLRINGTKVYVSPRNGSEYTLSYKTPVYIAGVGVRYYVKVQGKDAIKTSDGAVHALSLVSPLNGSPGDWTDAITGKKITEGESTKLQAFLDDEDIPEKADPGKSFTMLWADGRARLSFKSKAAVRKWLAKYDGGDPEVVWVRHQKDEPAESVQEGATGGKSRAFDVPPVQIEGDDWRIPYAVTPSKNFPGAYQYKSEQTGAHVTVWLKPSGKTKIISSKVFKVRVKITPEGDGEDAGEPFYGVATFHAPPFGYTETGRIAESQALPAPAGSISAKIEAISLERVRAKYPPKAHTEDWGSGRGGGKRMGGMVMGAMSAGIKGKKTYIDPLGNVDDLPKEDRMALNVGGMAAIAIPRYLKARTFGLDNEAAMTYVALTEVPGEFSADEIEKRMSEFV